MATNSALDLASVLEDILRREGPDLIENRSRLESLLRARAPDQSRAIHLLVTAVDAGIPARLRGRGSEASEIEIGQEAAQMVENFGSSPDHSRAAVETWAKSLARVAGAAEQGAASLGAATGTAPLAPGVEPGRADAEPGATPSPAQPAPAPAASPHEPGPSRAVPVRPLPLPTGAISQPVAPLPRPGAATPVQPLPPVANPTPVRPLPGPSGGPAPVQPLPSPARVQALPPTPGVSASAPATTTTGGMKWAVILPSVAAAILGSLWASGYLSSPVETPAPSGPRPPPVAPAAPTSPAAAGGKTDEGFTIADKDQPPNFKAERLDGDPNTLLYTFGLRFGEQTFTYQVAVAFNGAGPRGAGLIKAVKSGREGATDQLDVVRSMQDNGYVGFNLTGSLKGGTGAPSICAVTLAGKTEGRLDIANGGGLFCAFGTSATGLCTGEKIGCGALQ